MEKEFEKLSYSPEEAGAVISKSRTGVYGLIASGELKSYKDGRGRRITRRALEEYVARKEAKAA